ncbi:hypothetical protein JCM10207_002285 [Rhodosporidiobolus poonsookiae]
MPTPDIVPGSAQGQALQAAIQKQLATLGWSTEDDSVMAEYCLVMLGNRKTPDQISTELSDLIGSDFDASFVTWLFDEVKTHYPDPSASPAAPAAPAGPAASSSAPAASNGIPARPAAPLGANRNLFGSAVSGVKRGAGDLDGSAGGEGRQQRQRFDPPTGPRGQGGRSLFDRVNGNNPQFAPGRNMGPVNNTGMPQPAFDAITQTVQAVLNGAHPSILANVPFPALAAHPSAQRLPPHIMAQAQANAVAQAQALAAMQNVWNTPPGALGGAGGFGAPAAGAFNPNAAPFTPAGFAAGGRGKGANGAAPAKKAAPPVVLPSKPEQEALCKHGVECTKPQCPFSHPSPVATKESGLVLSSEACEKQLKCEDPDCPKSHVSVAQKTSPPASVSSGTTAVAPPHPPASSIAGAGEKPCKFGAGCTRAGCVFVHPWDVSGVPSGNGVAPCRYGAGCTRADCHFSHPSSRPAPYSRSKYSATFSSSTSGPKPLSAGAKKASQPSGIGAWPSESADHVSERLKRFSGGAGGEGKEGEVERIVPGQAGQGKDAEDKVEIHLDDEDDVKKEDKAVAA